MKVVHIKDIKEMTLPGRYMKQIITKDTVGAQNLSICKIRVPKGETVRPAHSHPSEEEAVYILKGQAEVYIDGEVQELVTGDTVFFPPGSIHMLRNTGEEDLEALCCFSPPTSIDKYRLYPEATFQKGESK